MRSILFLFIFLSALAATGQTVTGSWYGIADPAKEGMNNNYLTELIIKQKGDEVEGVFGYYFRNGYQSYYIRGKYNAKTRQIIIKDIPVTYYKNLDIDGVDCPMDFIATLMVSQVKSTMKGAFVTHPRYQYTCPELRVSYTLDESEKNQDSVIHNSVKIKKYWQPREEELVINTKDLPNLPAPLTAVPGTIRQLPDTLKHSTEEQLKKDAEKKKFLAEVKESFEKRKNIMMEQIEVESDSIRVSFYDNGDIDGDSISVFLNKLPVLTHQPLSAKALNMYLALDKDHDSYEIGMFAENLGLYPPNTALMVITDGEKRHEVFLSSSLTQNATVRIKRKKK